LLPLIKEEWDKAGLTPDRAQGEVMATIDLVKPRARNLKDFATAFRAYFSDEFTYDPAAVSKFLKDDAVRAMLSELAAHYESAGEFTEASTEQTLRNFAEEKGVKAGALINGARVCLTGQAVAPSLFAVIVNLGKERVVKRLAAAETIRSES